MRTILKTLLIGVSLLIPMSAYADMIYPWSTKSLTCGRAEIFLGQAGGNSVVETNVGYDIDTSTWTILHTLKDGTVIDRSIQYLIIDRTVEGHKTQWSGELMGHPGIVMVGEIQQLQATGQPDYHEWVYDHGRLTMHSLSLCRANSPPPAQIHGDPTD
jgi:hypothetical protein